MQPFNGCIYPTPDSRRRAGEAAGTRPARAPGRGGGRSRRATAQLGARTEHRCREINGGMDKVEIRTTDGVCPSYLSHPTGGGPWPAVLMYMDGVGIRPAMLEVGERLATYGYLVLLPDLFYRSGPYEPMNAAQVFADPQQRQLLRDRFSVHINQDKIMSDTEAFLAYLAARPDVKPGPVGATG